MRLGRLKHYIKLYMPYKWVLEYEEKRDFFSQYFVWKETNPHVEFDKESKFETIVNVEGFGYSGSGAVVDLLREYDDCLVHGMAEGGSKAIPAADDFGEIKFIKYAGGLMDIDSVVSTPAIVLGGDELYRFAMMANNERIYGFGTPYKDFFFYFFDSLIEDVIRNTPGSIKSIFPRIKDNIFIMKNISKENYYHLCQHFLYSIFNQQFVEARKYLVLDQPISVVECGAEYCQNFIPNIKSIVVYRDPRDIYTIVKRLDISWKPHDTVEHFIKAMKRKCGNFDVNSSEYLAIRFEDLIFDYDNTVARIEKYLNLGEHVRPQSCLDISISRNNIGIWKTAEDISQEEYDKILEAMPEFCYNK